MKRIAFATVLAGLSGVAAAQTVPSVAASPSSEVEVFGVIDAAVTHLQGAYGGITGLTSGSDNISRVGFRGTEDLGNGLKAGFWLEEGFNVTDGTSAVSGSMFNRRATVSLISDSFGEVRMGRDNSATFLSTLIFDPFITNGVAGTGTVAMLGAPGTGTATGGAPIQISNAISYFLPPNLGGVYGQLQYARQAENTSSQGNYRGLRLGYRSGNFDSAVAIGELDGDVSQDSLTASNVGLSYDFGVAKPMLLWAREKRGSLQATGTQLGVVVPVGADTVFRASFGHYNLTGSSHANWNKIGVGLGYDLSKRTQIYASYAYLKNSSAAAHTILVQGGLSMPAAYGGSASGVEVGIRTFF